nr:hypothetical protein GCM10020093_017710 [Planobispora longispora]
MRGAGFPDRGRVPLRPWDYSDTSSGQDRSAFSGRVGVVDAASGDERGTTERVLTLLGLLQQRQLWTGPELAERLGVTPRTVRRDVERLRALGYPVHAGHGVGGGYRLGPGRTCRRCCSTTRRRSPPRSRCSPVRGRGRRRR